MPKTHAINKDAFNKSYFAKLLNVTPQYISALTIGIRNNPAMLKKLKRAIKQEFGIPSFIEISFYGSDET
jgi:hypothetical protein